MTMVIGGPIFETLKLYRESRKTIKNDSEDFQYATVINHGDIGNFGRRETTAGDPIFLLENKTDQFKHTFSLVDRYGLPLTNASNYEIENTNTGDRVFYRPTSQGSGRIWHDDNRTDVPYYFNREFNLTTVPAAATATIDGTKSTVYLYVNGAFVDFALEGTTKASIDILPFLKTGTNEIVLKGINAPDDGINFPGAVGAGIGATFTGIGVAGTDTTTWSASMWSETGITGLIEYRVRQGGELVKKQDTVSQNVATLKSLANLMAMYAGQESTIISFLR